MKTRLAESFLIAIAVLIFTPACHYLTADFRAGNQAAAVHSILTVEKCAAAYSSDHPESGYPASLALLGQSGSNCVEPGLATGTSHGYTFAYTAGPKDAQGRVLTYTVTARPEDFRRSGDVNYFLDETGVIRSTPEDRPSTAQDPPLPQ
jgi:hypothetical protein